MVLDPQEQLARRRLWTAALPPFLGVLLLWVLFLFDRVYQLDYARLGVFPRVFHGLLGILTGPLVHGDAEHVFNNSVALLVLGWCLVYFYPKVAGRVVIWSWLASGAMVWLTARPSYHIGASGVVYGLASFLFLQRCDPSAAFRHGHLVARGLPLWMHDLGPAAHRGPHQLGEPSLGRSCGCGAGMDPPRRGAGPHAQAHRLGG